MGSTWMCPLLALLGLIALATPAAAAEPVPTSLDLFGDPLPTGATARLGTVGYRHRLAYASICFSRDSRSVFVSDADAIRIWDTALPRIRHTIELDPPYTQTAQRLPNLLLSPSRTT